MARTETAGAGGSTTSVNNAADDCQLVSWPDKLVFTDFLNTRHFVYNTFTQSLAQPFSTRQ